MAERPRSVYMAGRRVADVRSRFTDTNPRPRPLEDVVGIVMHHDGVLMAPGDRDYSGSTLDEDLERLEAIYRHSIAQGWARFPYHAAASPNGRAFLTLDLGSRGSHCRGKNRTHLGVVLLGNHMDEEPTPAQICAAGVLIASLWLVVQPHLPFDAHRYLTPPDHPTACNGDTWPQWAPRLSAAVVYHVTR